MDISEDTETARDCGRGISVAGQAAASLRARTAAHNTGGAARQGSTRGTRKPLRRLNSKIQGVIGRLCASKGQRLKEDHFGEEAVRKLEVRLLGWVSMQEVLIAPAPCSQQCGVHVEPCGPLSC